MTVAPMIDRLLPDTLKCRVNAAAAELVAEKCSPAESSECRPVLTAEDAVQPVVLRASAEWTWKRLPVLSPGPRNVSTIAVHSSRGKLLGWYICKLRQGGVARVAQIAARQFDAAAIINHLFARVREEGAVVVAGHMQPRFQQVLIDHDCRIRARHTYMLVHSRNKTLAEAFRDGKAWLSVLDGEATLNAWNSPAAVVAQSENCVTTLSGPQRLLIRG